MIVVVGTGVLQLGVIVLACHGGGHRDGGVAVRRGRFRYVVGLLVLLLSLLLWHTFSLAR